MRFGTVLFVKVLICLFIWPCNGAPPNNVGSRKSSDKFNKYTEEENELIVEELSSLLDVPYTFNIWSKIREKHYNKWKAGTDGFPQERSLSSIRSHFWKVLINNQLNVKVRVPEALTDKLNKATLNQLEEDFFLPNEETSEKGKHFFFTQQEEDLIVKELRKPSCTNFLGLSTLETIRAAHERKRRAGVHGFENERTTKNLRPHLIRMKAKGGIPSEVLEKFSSHQKGPRYCYTKEEDKVIIEVLSKKSLPSIFSSSAVELIRAEYDSKRKAKIHGFENARTAGSIRSRIASLRNSGLLPHEVTENYSTRNRGLSNSLGTSSGEPSNAQQCQLQFDEIMNGLNETETSEMIEELYNNTEYDLDFSVFHDPKDFLQN